MQITNCRHTLNSLLHFHSKVVRNEKYTKKKYKMPFFKKPGERSLALSIIAFY